MFWFAIFVPEQNDVRLHVATCADASTLSDDLLHFAAEHRYCYAKLVLPVLRYPYNDLTREEQAALDEFDAWAADVGYPPSGGNVNDCYV